jgi:hypothetical protein
MSQPERVSFPFKLPEGVQAPENASRPNWCGGNGCGKPAEPRTARCAACRDKEFTANILARRERAAEENDGRALAAIASEVAAWKLRGRRFFG